MFYERNKSLVLFSFVFKYQIVGAIVFEQRGGDCVFLVKMLLKKQRRKGSIDAFKFSIECTIVECYFFNNRISFNIIKVIKKGKTENFDGFTLNKSVYRKLQSVKQVLSSLF